MTVGKKAFVTKFDRNMTSLNFTKYSVMVAYDCIIFDAHVVGVSRLSESVI